MHRLIPCILFVFAALSSARSAPPDSAALTQWGIQVNDLAIALLDPAGDETLAAMLSEDVSITSFTGAATPVRQLQPSLRNYQLLGAHAYVIPTTSIADDLAADVAESQLPDTIKQALTPADRQASARANMTALQWLSYMLSARENDFVAVLLLVPPPGEAGSELTMQSLTFILAKGVPYGRGFRITMLIHGQPLQP